MASRFRKSHEVLQKEIEIGRKLVKLSMAGDGKATHELLKAGASVNAEEYNRSLFYASKNYMTPLQVASNAGHQKCVQILISYGGKTGFIFKARNDNFDEYFNSTGI